MARLYELTGAYGRLMDEAMAIDPETGEVFEGDSPEFKAILESLEGAIEDKAEGCAKVLKSVKSEVAEVKAEEERLAKRRKSMESNYERLRTYVRENLQQAGKEKIKTPLFTIWLGKPQEKVVIDDESLLPDDCFKEPKPPEPDKKVLKAKLQKGPMEGAHLEKGDPVLNVR